MAGKSGSLDCDNGLMRSISARTSSTSTTRAPAPTEISCLIGPGVLCYLFFSLCRTPLCDASPLQQDLEATDHKPLPWLAGDHVPHPYRLSGVRTHSSRGLAAMSMPKIVKLCYHIYHLIGDTSQVPILSGFHYSAFLMMSRLASAYHPGPADELKMILPFAAANASV